MARGKQDYIKTRISQLMEDAAKAHREEDKAWYMRICQELSWAKQYESKEFGKTCVIEEV